MGCEITYSNPITACNNQEGMIEKPFLVKKGFKFTTTAAALVLDNWITAKQAKDIIPLPSIKALESLNEGAIYEQTAYGSTFVRDGRKEMRVQIDSNSDLHKRLRSLKSSGEYGLIYAYQSGIIKAYQPEGTDEVHPFDLQMINTEYQNFNDGSVASKTPIVLTFADPKQSEDYPCLLNPTWNPQDLDALYSVDLAIYGTPSSTSIVVDITINHINAAVSASNPVEGLVAADFTLLTGAGVAQTISGVTESSTVAGRYTVAGTGLVSGTLNLKLPSLMTTKGYESTGAATVTIS